MKYLLAVMLALVSTIAPGGAVVCEFDASAVTGTLRIENICEGFRMWKTGKDSFTLVCPGHPAPPGAVELREYYVFKSSTGGPRR